MVRVDVKPELLRWAYRRAGLNAETAAQQFPQLEAWERGKERPTLKQLERYARATHAPIGYFFLSEPPVERVPIPDFRTMANRDVSRPSPDLLETVFLCEQRQEWYRDAAKSAGEGALSFVGSLDLTSPIETAAAGMSATMGFRVEERREFPTWTEALRRFIEQADDAGVLVMVSGVVANNNRRKLDPEEFRGFALSDAVAPLVFINGADTKSAQMFTLAHELAHVWLGRSGISDATMLPAKTSDIEQWCNAVAAELLVPMKALRADFRSPAALPGELKRLARDFKVSTLVILRRLHDLGALSRNAFVAEYGRELARIASIVREPGGNFYLTQSARLGKRFARTLIASTLEGRTLHRDALHLLGISKVSTFRELGVTLGIT